MHSELQILLIEDEPNKATRVQDRLSAFLDPIKLQFTVATHYEAALKALTDSCFDIAIVDLFIPGMQKEATLDASRALIAAMQSGRVNAPPHIIGLTRHVDSAREQQTYFDQCMFHLEVFDYINDVWAERIAGKIRYLVDSNASLSRFQASSYLFDDLILVAKHETEFKPILRDIRWDAEIPANHEMFRDLPVKLGTIQVAKDIARRTAIACIGEAGVVAAAARTTQLCLTLKPRTVVLLGMCCGLSRLPETSRVGDVVVATSAAAWDEGKYHAGAQTEDGFEFRGQMQSATPALEAAFRRFLENNESKIRKTLTTSSAFKSLSRYRDEYGDIADTPRVQAGLMLSGSSVIGSENKVTEIVKRFGPAKGLDMETYGVFKAAAVLPVAPPAFIAIKGVSDSGMKHAQRDLDLQPIASRLSYATYGAFLKSGFWK